MFNRTGLISNLLNKIQFTLLDFKPFQTIFSKVCINFSHQFQPRVTRGWRGGGVGGWVGGGGGWVGGWRGGWVGGRREGVGREEAKAPQVNT